MQIPNPKPIHSIIWSYKINNLICNHNRKPKPFLYRLQLVKIRTEVEIGGNETALEKGELGGDEEAIEDWTTKCALFGCEEEGLGRGTGFKRERHTKSAFNGKTDHVSNFPYQFDGFRRKRPI